MNKNRWKRYAIPFALTSLVVFLNFTFPKDEQKPDLTEQHQEQAEHSAAVGENNDSPTHHSNNEHGNHHEEQHHADNSEAHGEHHANSDKFDPGTYIIDHITDSYSWHIFTWKGTHVSLPLPVILYSKSEGLVVFSSAKFHHGHSAYKNFKIVQEGDHKGQIVQISNTGEITDMPLDISITKNILALLVSVTIILWLFLSVANTYKKNPGKAPKGKQNLLEPIIIFIRDDVAKASIGEEKYMRYTPFLLSVFFFIFINNLLGLIPIIPGGANLTGNISVTLVLALFTYFITTFSGNKNYWLHIFNAPGVPWWLKLPVPLIPLIEFMGTIIKPFVLMVRLFANITAGHIIALGFISLIFIFGEINPGVGLGVSAFSVAFGVFMMVLELLVAFIQAYVFTLLSAIYFGMAIEEHH